MHLSSFTDYSLRVLFYAASKPGLATMAEAADFYQISAEHLRKVVHCLAKAGYLKTYRGKNGGFELSQTPDMIYIGDLVKVTEGITTLIDCQVQRCCLSALCSLKPLLGDAQQAFIDTLNQHTLADLLQSDMGSQLLNQLH